jgi:hypothetical protein
MEMADYVWNWLNQSILRLGNSLKQRALGLQPWGVIISEMPLKLVP